jgi:hypothetical protein
VLCASTRLAEAATVAPLNTRNDRRFIVWLAEQ